MENPIITVYRGMYSRPANPVDAFDAANGKAWSEAGCPDDRPGTDWANWEDEASRVIASEYSNSKGVEVSINAETISRLKLEVTYADQIADEYDGERCYRLPAHQDGPRKHAEFLRDLLESLSGSL